MKAEIILLIQQEAERRVAEYAAGAGWVWTYFYGKRTVTETAPGGLRVTYAYNNRKDFAGVLGTVTVMGDVRET
jgi:hypothetical protein